MSRSLFRIGLCYSLEALDDKRALQRLLSTDLLIFPELLDGGYAALEAGACPHGLGDPLLRRMRALSRQGSLYCIAGSLCIMGRNATRTNSTIVYKNGRLLARYDKIHLFNPAGDHRFFSAGGRLTSFPLRVRNHRLRAGVMICYDLRFPELARALRLDGVEMFLVPARWPAVRDDAWRSLLKARAIENQAFVIGCNAKGKEGGFSYVFDPMGREVLSSRKKRNARIDVVSLDPGGLRKAKKLHDTARESRMRVGKRVFPIRRTAATSART